MEDCPARRSRLEAEVAGPLLDQGWMAAKASALLHPWLQVLVARLSTPSLHALPSAVS